MSKRTLWDLLNQYQIRIPIIQRDYAQGRESEKIARIRDEFLNSIFTSLENNNKLYLDFVYGSIEIDGDNHILYPLDGQQRLTTLFLIYWFEALRENRLNADIKTILEKFSYETRVSARQFCYNLVNDAVPFPITVGLSLSESIMDRPWFFLSWKEDPTVQAMLVMLDAINEKFGKTGYFFDKLISDAELAPITFSFLKLEDYKLGDELYIKMNARGKALTDFENFKARFGKAIDKNYGKNSDIYKEYCLKLDNRWTDSFWRFRQREDAAERNKLMTIDTIDVPFMRYFYFISEMLWILDASPKKGDASPFRYDIKKNPIVDYELIIKIYTNESSIVFLFKALDLIGDDQQNTAFDLIDGIYGSIGKVAVFDGESNLLIRCLRGERFDIAEKIQLFSIIKRALTIGKTKPDDDFCDFARVIRNCLLSERTLKNTRYASTLRYENQKPWIDDIASCLNYDKNAYILLKNKNNKKLGRLGNKHELRKAEIILADPSTKESFHHLEDHVFLQGDIHNLLGDDNKTYFNALEIDDIWCCKTSLIIRAMLVCGNSYIKIGYGDIGTRRFFGDTSNWYTILTCDREESYEINECLKQLAIAYHATTCVSASEKLQEIIDGYKTNKYDWRYYFIKYKEIMEFDPDSNKHVFAWRDDYSNRLLMGKTCNSYHINPYVLTVALRIKNKKICDIDKCWGLYSGEENISPLKLNNGICLYSLDEGWHVKFPNSISPSLKTKLIKRLSKNNKGMYILTETGNKDRVEIAVEFARESAN